MSLTDALALAGCDYLVVSPKVLLSLSTTATLQGYNDGLTAGPDSDGAALSPQRAQVRIPGTIKTPPHETKSTAQEVEFSPAELEPVTEQHFKEQLGLAAKELLAQGLESLRDDADQLDPIFEGRLAFGTE